MSLPPERLNRFARHIVLPEGTEDHAVPVIKRVMESAAEPAVRLTVPIQVDAHAARNWDEAH